MSTELHVVLGVGPLGQATAQALRKRGHQVRMVSRTTKQPLADVEHRSANLFDHQQVEAVTRGATAVYQCAQPAYEQWVTQFEPMQTAIIAGVARSQAKLVVAENLYMYGHVHGPIHEDLPFAAQTRKGQVRARMAQQLQQAHRQGLLQTTSARGSDFFGPGVLGSVVGERMFGPMLQGKAAQLTGRLDQPHSFSYISDFGETLATLGERPEALGHAWHVPNSPAITQQQLIDQLASILGHPIKTVMLGRVMLSLAGLFIPPARETVEMLYEFEYPFVVDSSRTTAMFGLQPTALEPALRATLTWYRHHLQGGSANVAPSHS